MKKVEIGDRIKITYMKGEPDYDGREGVIESIDDAGQLHGSWGGCSVIPETDIFHVLKEKRVRVLIFEPNKPPYEKIIENKLESYQKIVEGLIECVHVTEKIDIVCNDEGKLLNLPENRMVFDEYGHQIDIICGTFVMVEGNNQTGEFESLPDDVIELFTK